MEQRQHPRIDGRHVRLEQLILKTIIGEQFLHATCLDISEGGMRVQVDEELSIGDRLYALINLAPLGAACNDNCFGTEAIVLRTVKVSDALQAGLRFPETHPEIGALAEATPSN